MRTKSFFAFLVLGILSAEARSVLQVKSVQSENECPEFKDAFVRLNGKILIQEMQAGESIVLDEVIPRSEMTFSGSVTCQGKRLDLNKVTVTTPFTSIGADGNIDLGYGVKVKTAILQIGSENPKSGVDYPSGMAAKLDLRKKFQKLVLEKRQERVSTMEKAKVR